MKPKAKRAFAIVATVGACLPLAACAKQADVVSSNLSNAADNFQIDRQVTLTDDVTNENQVTVDGLCSLGNNDKPPYITVTCKVGVDAKGQGEYIKDIFVMSQTTSVAAVQLSPAHVSSAHYSVTWNPSVLVPNFNTNGAASSTPSAGQPSHSASAPASGNSNAKQPKVKVVVINQPAPPPPSSGS